VGGGTAKGAAFLQYSIHLHRSTTPGQQAQIRRNWIGGICSGAPSLQRALDAERERLWWSAQTIVVVGAAGGSPGQAGVVRPGDAAAELLAGPTGKQGSSTAMRPTNLRAPLETNLLAVCGRPQVRSSQLTPIAINQKTGSDRWPWSLGRGNAEGPLISDLLLSRPVSMDLRQPSAPQPCPLAADRARTWVEETARRRRRKACQLAPVGCADRLLNVLGVGADLYLARKSNLLLNAISSTAPTGEKWF